MAEQKTRRKAQAGIETLGLEIGNKPPQALEAEEAVLGAMLLEPAIVDAPDAIELDEVRGEIEFRDVWFAYEPGEWVLGRVAVRAPLRRRGYAEKIVREAVSRMKELGAASIRLGAQEYATGLYEKCGFVPCGPVYLDEGNPHVPMCLRLPHSGK